jgi:hypothetical protein
MTSGSRQAKRTVLQRHYLALTIGVAGALGCSDRGSPAAPSADPLGGPGIVANSAACADCLFGPVVLQRTTGAPKLHSVAVAGDPSFDYVLEVSNLTGSGTAVDVTVNGALVAEYRAGVAPVAAYPLSLLASNAITFRMLGKPGSKVSVRILGHTPPPPLETVFDGDIVGVSPSVVEAACLDTPLPTANDSHYVIRQLDRVITRVFDIPWPGRRNGDVHARQTATAGKYRFECTQRNRDGSTASQFVVELGDVGSPEITQDVKVCDANLQGGSDATAINDGQIACPYVFGNIFPSHPDYLTAGPFPTVEEVVVGPPMCTIFRPAVLGEGGRKHPVILWANGITLNPTFYAGMLRHFASHGFVVAAADTSRVGSAGNGQNLLACLAYIEAQNATGGAYAHQLNIYRVGIAGHSAGGAGVIMAGRDPRITATAPIQPWVGPQHGYDPTSRAQQNGPMFLTSGELDTEIPIEHVISVYTGVNVPIFWGHRLGSGHNDPLFDAPLYRRPLTAWFRTFLMLDNAASTLFFGANCQLCVTPAWVVNRKNGIQ